MAVRRVHLAAEVTLLNSSLALASRYYFLVRYTATVHLENMETVSYTHLTLPTNREV